MVGIAKKMRDMLRKPRLDMGAALLIPLPTSEVRRPREIHLQEWLGLSLDEAAPVRSVALLEVHGGAFAATIVDTTGGHLLWRVHGAGPELPALFEIMTGQGPRLTGVFSVPMSGPPGDGDGPVDLSDCPECEENAVTRTPIGSNGPPGRDPDLLALAKLFQHVVHAPRIRILGPDGKTERSALVVSLPQP